MVNARLEHGKFYGDTSFFYWFIWQTYFISPPRVMGGLWIMEQPWAGALRRGVKHTAILRR